MQDEWDSFIRESRNGTFLLDRHFMDYHSDRFNDCSVIFKEKNKVIACLPANYDTTSHIVYSHQGLTYGGLIMGNKITSVQVLDAFKCITTYYSQTLSAQRFIYKSIPYIYAKYPSEEDLYALFRMSATLISRGISSVIPLNHPLRLTESRKSGIRKAERNALRVVEGGDISEFWSILDHVLYECHSAHPVHSVAELNLLCSRFPDKIKLFTVTSPSGRMLAGTLIFDCECVIHTQYIAANKEGKEMGALDLLLYKLISERYSQRAFFDFGISTENGGTILNDGLIFQKEGFGGRGICYDTYEIKI